MKQRMVSTGLAALVLLVAPMGVLAQDDPSNTGQQKALTRQEIIEKRQAIRDQTRETLTAAREERIKLRCTAAQTKLQGILSRAAEYRLNHSSAYNSWQVKADNLLSRLEANVNIDTTQLETDLNTVEGLVQATWVAVQDYETELTTLTTVDCVADPQAFADALEVARDLRATAIDAIHSVREYINGTIKRDIAAIRDTLASENSGGES